MGLELMSPEVESRTFFPLTQTGTPNHFLYVSLFIVCFTLSECKAQESGNFVLFITVSPV